MKIFLYDGSKTQALNIREIAQYLKENSGGARIEVRNNLVAEVTKGMDDSSLRKLAEEIARCKIYDLHRPHSTFEPLPAEVEYEKRRLQNSENRSFGVLYDGFKLQALYQELIREEERSWHCLVIIFTDQLFGTWDENNRRYHARVSVYGFPTIISTTGIVEAPAKPREFYLQKQWGIDVNTLKKRFRDKFIDYDDTRLTEVMKGYCMQALFFYILGEPFCEDNKCRLYNAHWQEELINAQLTKPEFCKKHEMLIDDIRKCKLKINH
ncbi:MAG: hypothetical protein OEW43_06105 [Elusimicrobiota bacterium]|nr:hypothetical protein [Elusimicrobiota bacterium]MDH5661622.1 hypothetical protein [Elusimicrobiota bacterium]